MNLALYGGSFNPPHNGHVALARTALESLPIDRLIWMPSGDPPHKDLPEGTPSSAHRLAMSRLAVAGLPGVEVSDIEIVTGLRYTFDTVKTLLEQYNPDRFWLLMGQDMGESFGFWYKAEELRELCEIFVVSRSLVPISSTRIRQMLSVGEGRKWLPPAVFEHIRREGFYGYSRIPDEG